MTPTLRSVYLAHAVRDFWQDDEGQDLLEYALLLAFVALTAAVLFLASGRRVKGVWTTANKELKKAKQQAK